MYVQKLLKDTNMIYYKNTGKAIKAQRGYGAYAGSDLYAEAMREREEREKEEDEIRKREVLIRKHLTREEQSLINEPGAIGRSIRAKVSELMEMSADPFSDFDASQDAVVVTGASLPAEDRGNYFGMPNLYETDEVVPVDEEVAVTEGTRKTRDPGRYGFKSSSMRAYTSPRDRARLRLAEEAAAELAAAEVTNPVETRNQENEAAVSQDDRVEDVLDIVDNKRDSENKPSGAGNTDEEVIVEKSEGSGAKGKSDKTEKTDIQDKDTSEYNTKGLPPEVSKKILESKYSKTLKKEMLDVARWQTRHKKTEKGGEYLGDIDGMWGQGTQDAYDRLQEKKKNKASEPAVVVEETAPVETSPVDKYQYTDKLGSHYDISAFPEFKKGGILYPSFQRGGAITITKPVDRGIDLPIESDAVGRRRKLESLLNLQSKMGVKPDGIWGPKSQRAYDSIVRSPIDLGKLRNIEALRKSAGLR